MDEGRLQRGHETRRTLTIRNLALHLLLHLNLPQSTEEGMSTRSPFATTAHPATARVLIGRILSAGRTVASLASSTV